MIPTETTISNLIESQFPDIYRQEGPMLVQFVKSYYEWMESQGMPIYHARRLPTYTDIDSTLEEFLTYFKQKYLPNIQFNTATSKKLFVKNSLLFHRSKGTPRSVELFFKLVYGVAAEIYYPGDDILQTSSGTWKSPRYLEITSTQFNTQFEGKLIVGNKSGAKAFVDSYSRIRIKGRYIEVLYISDLIGEFISGEKISSSFVEGDLDLMPSVVGSLNSVDILDGGSSFEIGESVELFSNTGQFATGFVSNVTNIVGVVNLNLQNGGFGFNSNSEIIISDKILNISNVSNIVPERNTLIYERDSNNDVISTALIVGYSNNYVVFSNTQIGNVELGQSLSQGNISGIISEVLTFGSNTFISVQNVNGFYISGQSANTPTGSILVQSISLDVGISNISGPGIFSSGSDVSFNSNTINGVISSTLQTSNSFFFSFSSNNTFDFLEVSNVGIDFIEPYKNVQLNNTTYGFPKLPSGNSSTLIINTLQFENRSYGSISNSSIIGIFSGSGYAKDPYILIKEEIPLSMKKPIWDLILANTISQFVPGEIVTSGVRLSNGQFTIPTNSLSGRVSSVVPGRVRVDRLNLIKKFSEHSPDNNWIIGETSGATARIAKAEVLQLTDTYIGYNANLIADALTSNGAVASIILESSGFGFLPDQIVNFVSKGNNLKTGLAISKTDLGGKGIGYFSKDPGAPSSNKRIQDNYYYQDFSYEIRTSIQPSEYKKMFDDVIHVAGTQGFYSYLSVEKINSPISVVYSDIETDNIALFDFSNPENSTLIPLL